jgi:uncharacterized protein YcbK (DUF882 family)
MTDKVYLPRRNFIKTTGLGLIGSCFLPRILLGSSQKVVEKKLNLYNVHTGESFKGTFWAEGQYDPAEINLLNRFMRDWRSKKQTEMCPELFDLLHNITHKLETSKPMHIFSAYRCKETNEKLRTKKNGIAEHSRHITGHAIDFNIQDQRLSTIRNCALSFQAGGVGYYPKTGFVHVDIRDKPVQW